MKKKFIPTGGFLKDRETPRIKPKSEFLIALEASQKRGKKKPETLRLRVVAK